MPVVPLSIQFIADRARDLYDDRPLGPDTGKARFHSVDATYEVGTDLQRSSDNSDNSEYVLEASTGSLPDVNYELNAFKLYARYTVRENYGVRADFIHERWKTDEWAWMEPTFYNDGDTTISQDAMQRVNFIGLSLYYQWL